MQEVTRRGLIKLGVIATGGAVATRFFPLTPDYITCSDKLPRDIHRRVVGATIQVNRPTIPEECPNHRNGTWASGFYIGDGMFMTNRHVLFKDRSSQPFDETVKVDPPVYIGHPRFKYFPISHATRFNGHDLAIMHTGETGFTALSPTLRIPRVGEPVYAYTYKGDTRRRFGTDAIHTTIGRYLGCIIIKNQSGDRSIVHSFTTDFQTDNPRPHIVGGASGSPLVDDKGNVFGVICSHGNQRDTKLQVRYVHNVDTRYTCHIGFAVPLQHPTIRGYLESNGIIYHRP